MNRIAMYAVAALILASGMANAQDRPQVGVTMTYPARIGVLWHITDRVAILPDVALERFSWESEFSFGLTGPGSFIGSTSRATNITWELAPGANLLVDLARWDDVATYLTGGWSYLYLRETRTEVTTSTGQGTSFPPSGTEVTKSTDSGHETRGAFGVRYVPSRRFGIYGEVGVEYRKSSQTTLTSSTLRNRGAVGAIFYF